MASLMKCFVASMVCMVSFNSFAEERARPEEAEAMVKKVVAAIKANGRDKVLAEINSLQGSFRDQDLYVTAIDFQGLELAHGANKKMQGVNLFELKDADGKYFVKEKLEMAKKTGKGWHDYKFVNPSTKNLEAKTVYFERVDDIVISCGAYKDAK